MLHGCQTSPSCTSGSVAGVTSAPLVCGCGAGGKKKRLTLSSLRHYVLWLVALVVCVYGVHHILRERSVLRNSKQVPVQKQQQPMGSDIVASFVRDVAQPKGDGKGYVQFTVEENLQKTVGDSRSSTRATAPDELPPPPSVETAPAKASEKQPESAAPGAVMKPPAVATAPEAAIPEQVAPAPEVAIPEEVAAEAVAPEPVELQAPVSTPDPVEQEVPVSSEKTVEEKP